MDYFASLENTTYCLWQSEFLIQSFKMTGQRDNLVLGVAGNNQIKTVDFVRNLKSHKRRFLHENIGRKRGILGLNRPYAVYNALKTGMLKQPFCLISPDMVITKEVVKAPGINVSFQLNSGFTRDSCEANGVPVAQTIADLLSGIEKADKNCWVPLGSVMVFDGVPIEFFQAVINWTETLEFERQKRNPKNESNSLSEKAAWVLALIEYWGTLSVHGRADLEMHLLDHQKESHFVHYKHGLPPYFSKGMFRYEPPACLALGDLYQTLLSQNPTTSTEVLQKVVRAYIEEFKIDISQPEVKQVLLTVAGKVAEEQDT